MDDDGYDNAELRDHAFDGIQEYDNNLPLWWQAIFYLTIVWAVGYVAWYHFGPGQLGAERLEAQLAVAEQERLELLAQQGELSEEMLRDFLSDQSRVRAGREVYVQLNCRQCHGADGLGTSAPNLRDDYWKWGSDMMDIYESLRYGRNEGQMPANDIPREQLINLTVFLVDWNKNEKAHGRGIRIDGSKLDPIDY